MATCTDAERKFLDKLDADNSCPQYVLEAAVELAYEKAIAKAPELLEQMVRACLDIKRGKARYDACIVAASAAGFLFIGRQSPGGRLVDSADAESERRLKEGLRKKAKGKRP